MLFHSLFVLEFIVHIVKSGDLFWGAEVRQETQERRFLLNDSFAIASSLNSAWVFGIKQMKSASWGAVVSLILWKTGQIYIVLPNFTHFHHFFVVVIVLLIGINFGSIKFWYRALLNGSRRGDISHNLRLSCTNPKNRRWHHPVIGINHGVAVIVDRRDIIRHLVCGYLI